MPRPTTQLTAITGRQPPNLQSELLAAQFPLALQNQQRRLEEARLASLRQAQAAEHRAQQQANLISGAGALVQGAGLLEQLRPGTLSRLGQTVGAPLARGASGAARALGVGPAADVATASEEAFVGAGAATGGLTGLEALGSAGAGFGAGQLIAQTPLRVVPETLLPFGGRTGRQIERTLGGAAAGAGAGFALGGPPGAIIGGITGALGGASIIATATCGPASYETQLAVAFRRKYVGATEYYGYLLWGAPLAALIHRYPRLKPVVRWLLVDPFLVYCVAMLTNATAHLPRRTYYWSIGLRAFSKCVGRVRRKFTLWRKRLW